MNMNLRKKQSGFSLIEIMVVLVIIGLLASIVGPRVIGQAEEARKKKAVADFANLATALKMYKNSTFQQVLHMAVKMERF